MKILTALLALAGASLVAIAGEYTSTVTVNRKSDQKSMAGPETYFTGRVQVAAQFERAEPSRVTGAIVTFDPGARTAWHMHPAGQTLIVTRGVGFVQQWGAARQEIREGDVVWIPPRTKHWHGATSSELMSHVAIQEKHDGTNVEWMEKVSDAQYSEKQ